MIPPLPPEFLGPPITHRALHDPTRAENSPDAIEAAAVVGYGIEVDVQLSADNRAVVFHDHALRRLAGREGAVHDLTAAELSRIPLLGGGGTIPPLTEVLEIVDGRVPLLIELKDQTGAMGPDTGALEAAVARDLSAYPGQVALMSFNPHSVAAVAELAPRIPRGLTTAAFRVYDWRYLPTPVRQRLRGIPDFDRVGAAFISHHAHDLARPRVIELKRRGVPVLCWTIRSAEQEARARQIADNITFEGYPAQFPQS